MEAVGQMAERSLQVRGACLGSEACSSGDADPGDVSGTRKSWGLPKTTGLGLSESPGEKRGNPDGTLHSPLHGQG